MADLALIEVGSAHVGYPRLEVVFVHGLGGDSDSTWRSPSLYWPEELARRADVRVWTLDYPADATRWTNRGAGLDLVERGRSVLDYLVANAIGDWPVMFVAHSLGGLVVKQLLRLAKEMSVPKYEPIWKQTRAVVFLATPHAGSDLATFGKLVKVARLTSVALDLEAESTQLKELGDWYRQNAPGQGISTAAYAEGKPVRGSLVVVDRTRADPGVPDCLLIPTDEDHVSIAKPTGVASPVALGVAGLIDQTIAALDSGLGRATDAARELKATVASVQRYSPQLLQTATPQTAARLRDALREVELTYEAMAAAARRWIGSSLSSSGELDGGLMADLVTGNLAAEIHKGRGSCARIGELYRQDGGIRQLIDATAIPPEGKAQLHRSFGQLSEADMDLFMAFEQAGGFMQTEAEDIASLITQNRRDEAMDRLRSSYGEVKKLQLVVNDARTSLLDVQRRLT